MLSSGQVAAMMSQQNQMFAGAAQYSHQISASMPGMYGSGDPGSGGGFSYGGHTPLGYDFSSRASGGIVSAMGGAANFALGAAGIMGGMGMLGGFGRAVLDPFAGGGAMYNLGGRMGMGMMGRLGMGALGMAPVMAGMGFASHAIGQTVAGAQQQGQVEQVLGRHNFINPATGNRGFSRQQAMAVGDMMRQMESLPELMTSMGELTRIMDKMGSMGLMQGAQNVSDFGQKFKDTINVLKDMSKVMGTTMEQALPLFGEIRRSGIYSTTDILKNAMNRQITGGVTGMNQAQVGALQSMGSQVSFAYGGSRAGGARHALRVANQLGMANQLGYLSNDQIMELTGMEGAAGIQAMAGQLTQTGYRMSRGALGTAMTLALGAQEDGRYTGEMDTDLMEQFRSGSLGRDEILRMARQKSSSRAAKLSFVARRERMRANMASTMGVEGQLQTLKSIMGERGFQDPDELRIVARRFGMSEREADLMVNLADKFPDMQLELGQRRKSETKRLAQEAFMKENYSWNAVKGKLGKKMDEVFAKPFRDFGADLRNSVNQTIDDFIDDITGRYKVEVTKGMSGLARGAMGDIGTSRARMGDVLNMTRAQTNAGLRAGQDLTTGYAGAAVDWMTGRTTAGERLEGMAGLFGVTVGERDVGTGGNYNMAPSWATGGRARRGDIITSRDYGRGWTGNMGQGQINQERYIKARDLERMNTAISVLRSGGDTETIRRLKGGGGSAGLLRDYKMMMLDRPEIAGMEGEQKLLAMRGALFSQAMRSGNLNELYQATGGDLGSFLAYAERETMMGGPLDEAFGAIGQAYSLTSAGGQKIAGDIKKQEERIRRSMGSQKAEEIFGMVGAEGGGAKMAAIMGTMGGLEGLYDVKTETKFVGKDQGGQVTVRTKNYQSAHRRMRRLVMDEMEGKTLSQGQKEMKKTNAKAYTSVRNEILMSGAIGKAMHGGTFTEEEVAYLKSMGYKDPQKDFTAKEAQKLQELRGKIQAAANDPSKKKELADYLSMKATESNIEMGSRMAQAGEATKRRLQEIDAMDLEGFEEGSDAAKALGLVRSIADRQAGASTWEGLGAAMGLTLKDGQFVDAGGRSVGQDIGEAAAAISKLGKRERAIVMAAGEESGVSAAVRRYDIAKKMAGRGGRGLDKTYAAENFIGAGAEEKELAARIREFKKDGKWDVEGFAKFMAGQQGVKGLTMAGVEDRSKYANQAEIARSMAQFSENTRSLASIVEAMGGGKEKGKGGGGG